MSCGLPTYTLLVMIFWWFPFYLLGIPEGNVMYLFQVLSRQICVSSALHRKNLAALGPEKFTAEFVQKQVEEYNIGKRHLANMMGEDPENFTQEDIDVRQTHKSHAVFILM